MSSTFRVILHYMKAWKRFLILFLTPLLLLPIPVVIQTQEAKTTYCILILAVFWMSEVTPLAVTSLLPLVMFPVLGVLKAKEVSVVYFKDTNVLLLGGLMLSIAIEKWNVHKRISLKVLLIVGAQPRRLMLGFMSMTAFISMWITNTATTAMMTPIMEAVLQQIDKEYIAEEITRDEGDVYANENTAIGNSNHQKLSDENAFTDDADEKEKDNSLPRYPGADQIEMDTNDAALSKSTTLTHLVVESDNDGKPNDPPSKHKNMCKAMMLCICYAANIGGTGSLTGTTPQLILAGQLSSIFPKAPKMSFSYWFAYAFPEMVILLLLAWIYLQAIFFGIGLKHIKGIFRCKKQMSRRTANVQAVMRKQYESLGPMSFAEYAVLFHFVLLVLFWFLRDPKFIPGWGALFKEGYVSDATPAILITFSLFQFPSRIPDFFYRKNEQRPPLEKDCVTLLSWNDIAKKFPWNVILLMGSGFAMASACEKSGLSQYLGCQLTGLSVVPNYAAALVVAVMLTFLTEVTSNTATSTILLPVLAALSQSIKIHPLYLMMPAAVCASFAFMLPVATPPNAIVFSTGRLTIPDMAKAGLGMNFIGIAVVTLFINTWGLQYYGLDTFPVWAALGKAEDKCNPIVAALNATVAPNTTMMSSLAPITT